MGRVKSEKWGEGERGDGVVYSFLIALGIMYEEDGAYCEEGCSG